MDGLLADLDRQTAGLEASKEDLRRAQDELVDLELNMVRQERAMQRDGLASRSACSPPSSSSPSPQADSALSTGLDAVKDTKRRLMTVKLKQELDREAREAEEMLR